MKNKKNFIFWVIVALIGIGLVSYSYFSRPVKYVEQTPTPQTTPAPTEEPFSSLNGIKSPATCQISGEANFSNPNLFSSDTKLSWQNVDSQGRLINWKISPQDNLTVGPNLFASLTVPNGEYENITVRLPEKPISKTYLLTASVTYGQFIQGDLKVKEANCSGQIKVNLNF